MSADWAKARETMGVVSASRSITWTPKHLKLLSDEKQYCGAGSVGSVIELPPGAGTGTINSELQIRIRLWTLKTNLGEKFNSLSFLMLYFIFNK
jgi:hypothetical protein